MNTPSINLTKPRTANSASGQAIEVAAVDWVESNWQISVRPSSRNVEFTRNRPQRPDPTITILVPPISRAILSNQQSHLFVGRHY